MIKLIAVAGFALSVATSAQAFTPAPFPEPDAMITQIAAACGAGRTRINGVRGKNDRADAPSCPQMRHRDDLLGSG
jgi:hypothetical protein